MYVCMYVCKSKERGGMRRRKERWVSKKNKNPTFRMWGKRSEIDPEARLRFGFANPPRPA